MGFITRKLIKTESQPVLIPAGYTGGQIYFPDNQYIRNKKLMAINLLPDLATAFGLAPMKYVDGKQIMSYGDLSQFYITLESYSGVQFVRKKPILEFIPYLLQGVGNTTNDDFCGQRVNWPKCYVEASNFGATAKDFYILFDIHFTETSQETLKTQLDVEFKNKR